jgi:hypothetical protein
MQHPSWFGALFGAQLATPMATPEYSEVDANEGQGDILESARQRPALAHVSSELASMARQSSPPALHPDFEMDEERDEEIIEGSVDGEDEHSMAEMVCSYVVTSISLS